MEKSFKELYKAFKRLRGEDPLNLSNLEFIKKNENIDDYIKRVYRHLKFKRLSTITENGPIDYRKANYSLKILKNDLNKAIATNKSLLEKLHNSPFLLKDCSIGFVINDANISGIGIHFPEIIIYNYKHETHHKITDLVFLINNGRFFGYRTSFIQRELDKGYVHSHLHTLSIDKITDPITYINEWCLGYNQAMGNFKYNIAEPAITQDYVDSFVLTLNKYLTIESSEGTPYIHFSQLYANVSNHNFNIKLNITPVLSTILQYIKFKYNNGDIDCEIDPSIISEKSIIDYFGVECDEFGNTPYSGNRNYNLYCNFITNKITKKIKINKISTSIKLPNNFIDQLKTIIINNVNSYTNKATIFATFNSSRDQHSSPLVERIDEGNKILESSTS